MLQLNPKDHAPLYEQIKEQLKNMIVEKVLKANDKIPSVRELAQMLTINPNTIQKAYKELEQEGFIYSIRAKGSFVTPQDNTLRKIRKQNLMNSLEKTVKELIFIGIPSEELVTFVKHLYEEEGKRAND